MCRSFHPEQGRRDQRSAAPGQVLALAAPVVAGSPVEAPGVTPAEVAVTREAKAGTVALE